MTGIPDALPQLAVGTWRRGSGKACIMNAISYLNGDEAITDTPDCADVTLAHVAIRTNDMICVHRFGRRIQVLEALDPGSGPVLCGTTGWWKPDTPAYAFVEASKASEVSEGSLLCLQCSAKMWALGSRIIGTSAVWSQDPSLDQAVVQERLAWEFLTRTFDWFASDLRLEQYRRGLMQEMQRVLAALGEFVTNPALPYDPASRSQLRMAADMLALAPYAGPSNKRDELLVHGVRRLGEAILCRTRRVGSQARARDCSLDAIKAAFIGIGGPDILQRAVEFIDRWYALTGWNTVRDFTVEDIARVRTEAGLIPA